jgi:hypothetical protein
MPGILIEVRLFSYLNRQILQRFASPNPVFTLRLALDLEARFSHSLLDAMRRASFSATRQRIVRHIVRNEMASQKADLSGIFPATLCVAIDGFDD